MATAAATQDNDVLGQFIAQGVSSAGTPIYFNAARFRFVQDGAATANGNPTEILFLAKYQGRRNAQRNQTVLVSQWRQRR